MLGIEQRIRDERLVSALGRPAAKPDCRDTRRAVAEESAAAALNAMVPGQET